MAIEQLNAALSPFGLTYGNLRVVGATTADLTLGWADPYCSTYWEDESVLLFNPNFVYDGGLYQDPPQCLRHYPNGMVMLGGGAKVTARLAWHFLGLGDGTSAGSLDCLLGTCSFPSGMSYYIDAAWPLSEQGKDLVRYWALMNRTATS